MVDDGNFLNASDRAGRRAGFGGQILAAHVCFGVLLEGNARITAFLRAVMNEPVFANVNVPASGAASPLPRPSARRALLNPVPTRIAALPIIPPLAATTLLPPLQPSS